MLGYNKVCQRKSGGFVMAQGTEDAAGAFHSDEVVFSTKGIVCFLYLFPFDGISFYLRRKMGRNGSFVYIRAHILKGLGNARSGFHKVRVTRQKGTIRKTDIATHGGFEISGFFAVFMEFFQYQPTDVSFAYVRICANDHQLFHPVSPRIQVL